MASVKNLKDGNKMPVLGLGTYLENRAEVVSWAVEAGYRLFDTATLYKYKVEKLYSIPCDCAQINLIISIAMRTK